MKPQYRLLNEKGMSLVGVLVGSAIALAVMLAISSGLVNAFKSQKSLQIKTNFNNIQQQLITSFSDPEICTKMLAGNKILVTKKAPNPLVVVKDPILGPIQSGTKVDDVTLSSVHLSDLKYINSTTVSANLNLVPDNAQTAMKGKKIPVYFSAVSNVIVDCKGSEVAKTLCESMGGTYEASETGSMSCRHSDLECPDGQILVGPNKCKSIKDVLETNPATKTFYLSFYNGCDKNNGMYIGEVYLHEGESRLVSVSTPAGRNTKLVVAVKDGKVSVKTSHRFFPNVCRNHGEADPCRVDAIDPVTGYKDYNCGIPVGWKGDAEGNTSRFAGVINCGNWTPGPDCSK